MESQWMLHMYKNMHYIYINIYTMCKTYGITNNKRHGMGGGDKRGDSATDGDSKSKTDEGGEPRCLSPVLPLMCPEYMLSNETSCSELCS